jgi:RNA-directed DNA polymerase
VNTGAPWPSNKKATARVLEIQTKLHRWATDDSERRFRDLFNLVCDPAFLVVAWRRVRGNKGARAAGVDAHTAYSITVKRGERAFLSELRADLKAGAFHPLPVRERLIPKPDGNKRRRLGIPTVRDRVVQAALKLERDVGLYTWGANGAERDSGLGILLQGVNPLNCPRCLLNFDAGVVQKRGLNGPTLSPR